MRINGFEQIKAFYSWVFENPDKVRPTHISLYLFLWNQGNRANWVEWFKCPYDLAMQGACIGSKGTYYKCLDDLQSFNLIEYKKGVNNYKAPQIHLIKLYNNGQVTEQPTVPLSEPQSEPLSVLLPEHIYKLITNNHKLVTDNIERWLKPSKPKRTFTPPTIDEIKEYCKERKNSVNAETFIDFYSSKGWLVGKNKMKDWKASIRTWEKRENNGHQKNSGANKTAATEFNNEREKYDY